ncbi:AAA domain-containing protein [Bacillus sp. FSL W7-1360]
MNHEQRVLKAWWVTELLQMPSIDEKSSSIERLKLRQGKEMPWTQNKTENHQNIVGYRIYIGIMPLKGVMTFIRDTFASTETFYQMPDEKKFMAVVHVAPDGQYQGDGLQLPYMSVLLGKLRTFVGEKGYDDFIDYFNTIEKELQALCNQLFYGKHLGEAHVKEMKAVLVNALQFPEHLFVQAEQGYLFDCRIEKLTKRSSALLMKSFFAEELQMLSKKKALPPALLAYLNGCQQRTDVNEVREVLEDWIDPGKMPPARWPAPAHHHLSLMQQVAVNVILSGESPLDTVNGPPGTGKTMLLKEVFAARVFERAKAMVAFQHPADAFTPMDTVLKTTNFSHHPFQLDPSITGYSMVVASSNNAAVENIFTELSNRKAVVREKDEKLHAASQAREQEIAHLAAEVDYFSSVADGVGGVETGSSWGLFSVALGNKKNNDNFSQAFWYDKAADHKTMAAYLADEGVYDLTDWERAKEAFLLLSEEIEKRKSRLAQCAYVLRRYEALQERKKEVNELLLKMGHNLSVRKQRMIQVAHELAETKASIKLMSMEGLWPRIKGKWIGRKTKLTELKQQLTVLERELGEVHILLVELEKEIEAMKRERDEWNEMMDDVAALLKRLRKEGVIIPDDDYWEGSYAQRQKTAPWLSEELNHLRSQAFLLALKVHKVFLFLARDRVKRNMRVYFNRKQFDLNTEVARQAVSASWQTLFLMIPVVSTTFASAGRLFCELGAEEIGDLFIDEAGQAVPQAAAGMIYRSKHAVIVGDPKQIEPVVTMPETLLHDIRTLYKVEEAYISSSSSVQLVANLGNPMGTFIGEQWIGLPLWVHRRCADPMFTIANTIAYENKMILFSDKHSPHSRWVNVTGSAVRGQYIEEQGQMVEKLVFGAFEQGVIPSLYVITPFPIVKEEIKKKLRHKNEALAHLSGHPVEEINHWIQHNIGTVHTFQGKEADTVVFVVGTDECQTSAANWIVAKPNLINVAVTRAKETIVIIGDRERLSKLPYFDVVFDILEELAYVELT